MQHMIDTATVWSAVAALWALAAAWFTYKASVNAGQQSTFKGLQNIITGVREELELISLWAGPDDDAPGYLDSKPREQWFNERGDWRSPERIIYTFEYPTVKSLSSSPYVRYLEPIIGDFVTLNYSIVRLFDYYEEYRQFVVSQPALRRAMDAPRREPVFTQEEEWFLSRVFEYNYVIHVKLVGGADSADERCLHKSFRRAKRSLHSFASRLAPESSPWWHWLVHGVAFIFLIAGVALILKWLYPGIPLWPDKA